ncbi:hypothetical protein M9H77_02078 [Catharanthus roseus]|uniref:Uncharacterized protein n=1 Tax=Catharanthus roseus TaxID=4058 RepID=A0ACC0C7E7_CATRO|nr:hypothetical protein M9H77_02078 [Catharanthus roseus]
MNNLSKICSLISDSLATKSRDPTLFSNLVARLIGTPVSASCIQILGIPSPAFTKNISSLKRKTSYCKAFPLHKKKLELDLGNDMESKTKNYVLIHKRGNQLGCVTGKCNQTLGLQRNGMTCIPRTAPTAPIFEMSSYLFFIVIPFANGWLLSIRSIASLVSDACAWNIDDSNGCWSSICAGCYCSAGADGVPPGCVCWNTCRSLMHALLNIVLLFDDRDNPLGRLTELKEDHFQVEKLGKLKLLGPYEMPKVRLMSSSSMLSSQDSSLILSERPNGVDLSFRFAQRFYNESIMYKELYLNNLERSMSVSFVGSMGRFLLRVLGDLQLLEAVEYQ